FRLCVRRDDAAGRWLVRRGNRRLELLLGNGGQRLPLTVLLFGNTKLFAALCIGRNAMAIMVGARGHRRTALLERLRAAFRSVAAALNAGHLFGSCGVARRSGDKRVFAHANTASRS